MCPLGPLSDGVVSFHRPLNGVLDTPEMNQGSFYSCSPYVLRFHRSRSIDICYPGSCRTRGPECSIHYFPHCELTGSITPPPLDPKRLTPATPPRQGLQCPEASHVITLFTKPCRAHPTHGRCFLVRVRWLENSMRGQTLRVIRVPRSFLLHSTMNTLNPTGWHKISPKKPRTIAGQARATLQGPSLRLCYAVTG